MRFTHFLAAVLISFMAVQSSAAQDSASVASTTDARVKTLEAIVSKLPKISGLVNLRYQYSTQETHNNNENGFDVRRLYLNFNGNITPELSYRVQLDFAGTPQILDAYAEWKPCKYIGLQVGQFKVPYTLENPYAIINLETADYAQAVSALIMETNGVKTRGRDVGIALNGSLFQKDGYNLIDYKVALLNGNGINVVDNNTTKDVVGTLWINPMKPLSVSLSYYNGEFGAQSTKISHKISSLGVKYEDGKWLVRSEYITGKLNDVYAKGFYISTACFVTKKLQPVLKYDYYQSDNSNSQSPVTNYSAGLNYWITKSTKLQLFYTFNDFKDPLKHNASYVVSQLLLTF